MIEDERRNSPRMIHRTLVSFTGIDRNNRRTSGGTGYAINFSRNGMLIETTEKIETDVISFVMLDPKGRIFSSTGRVVHLFNDEAGRYFTGIHFIQPYQNGI